MSYSLTEINYRTVTDPKGLLEEGDAAYDAKVRTAELTISGAELTAGQVYTFFLDAFLDLYRNHRDLLRFNQFFNIYLQGAGVDKTRISSYSEMVDRLADAFSKNWEKGRVDGTLRTDIPWQEIFSSSLHLMLSAVTRYAVGLVYQMEEGGDPEQELLLLRDMLLRQYTAVPCGG